MNKQKVSWDHSDFLLSIFGYRCDRYYNFVLEQKNRTTTKTKKKNTAGRVLQQILNLETFSTSEEKKEKVKFDF